MALATTAVVIHGVAIAIVSARQGRIDAYAFQSLDCGEYYAIARNIADHGAFSQSESPPLSPDTWRTPGYPLFLAAVMLVAGDSPAVLILIQHALAALSVLLIFEIASRHLRPWAATVAALIFLLEPYHLFYSFWLLSTTFFTFMLLATWWLWERFRLSAGLWHSLMLGLLAGYLVLIWPGAIFVPVFLLVGGGVLPSSPTMNTPPNRPITTSPHWILIFAVLAGAMVVPPAAWMARNKIVAGHFALSHQSGIVLAYFKATEVELWKQGRTEDRYVETSLNPKNRNWPHSIWDKIDKQLQARVLSVCPQSAVDQAVENPCNVHELSWENLAQGNKTSHDSFVVSHLLASIGSSMLMEAPFATITCWLSRIAENLAFPLGLSIAPPREAPVQKLRAVLLGSMYLALLLAALAGLVRSRKNWTSMLFPIACLIALSLTTAPQIDPRFRVPMIPLLAFLALLPFHAAGSEESVREHPR